MKNTIKYLCYFLSAVIVLVMSVMYLAASNSKGYEERQKELAKVEAAQEAPRTASQTEPDASPEFTRKLLAGISTKRFHKSFPVYVEEHAFRSVRGYSFKNGILKMDILGIGEVEFQKVFDEYLEQENITVNDLVDAGVKKIKVNNGIDYDYTLTLKKI